MSSNGQVISAHQGKLMNLDLVPDPLCWIINLVSPARPRTGDSVMTNNNISLLPPSSPSFSPPLINNYLSIYLPSDALSMLARVAASEGPPWPPCPCSKPPSPLTQFPLPPCITSPYTSTSLSASVAFSNLLHHFYNTGTDNSSCYYWGPYSSSIAGIVFTFPGYGEQTPGKINSW